MAVKADELVRKPFQPQDLIARVKSLLKPASVTGTSLRDEETNAAEASRVLGGLFSAAPVMEQPAAAPAYRAAPLAPQQFQPRLSVQSPASAAPGQFTPLRTPPTPPAEVQKLRNEIRRLELFVKKLQSELDAQRQYCTALEAHCKTLQDAE